MIYIVCFFLATIFSLIANKYDEKSKKYKFFSLIAIILPALLAGLRDVSVGTDVTGYVVPSFKASLVSSSFSSFSNLMFNYNLDYMFRVLTYYSSVLFKDIRFVLFCESLITVFFFYIGSKNIIENKKGRPFVYLMFLLLYYNMSLNIIRQFIAVSIILYSYKFIKEEKIIKYFVTVLIATLFHNTAIIGVLLYVIYLISKNKHRLLYSLAIFIILFGIMFNYNTILVILSKTGIVATRYVSRYALGAKGINISFADEIIKIYTLFLLVLTRKVNDKDKDYPFLCIVSIFDFLLFQIGAFVDYASRITLYFGVFSIVLTSKLVFDSKKNKKILCILTLIIYFIYFVYMYIICNNGNTYPYIFMR